MASLKGPEEIKRGSQSTLWHAEKLCGDEQLIIIGISEHWQRVFSISDSC